MCIRDSLKIIEVKLEEGVMEEEQVQTTRDRSCMDKYELHIILRNEKQIREVKRNGELLPTTLHAANPNREMRHSQQSQSNTNNASLWAKCLFYSKAEWFSIVKIIQVYK